MSSESVLLRLGLTRRWSRELGLALCALAFGFGAMGILIFLAGAAALGRYDGATPARLYDSLYQGLMAGSTASWIVVLGPYGLCLLLRVLAWWWRASARLA